ncbi:MAG: MBL fold metallo-hydrolase [Bacteroidaceae bacterium]|nr:MBL fold metallo-hydrolase [Bacteroidaceae bacterium]
MENSEFTFICLASGSSGNCFYLSMGDTTILIDAGLSQRQIKKALKEKGLPFSNVKGIFITHDHADHIKGVGNLANENMIPVYATTEVHKGMKKSYCMTREIDVNLVRRLEKGEPLQLGPFEIHSFEVPHDGSDNVGYFVTCNGVNFCIVTDIGHITQDVAECISQANYLVLEANYDKSMLEMGPYPRYLKERIASDTGHLSNEDCGKALLEFATPELKHVWLCHLSEENNHPELARKTVDTILRSAGIIPGKDILLDVLRRKIPSEVYFLK